MVKFHAFLTLHVMHVHGYLHTLADFTAEQNPSTLCVEIWVGLSIVLNQGVNRKISSY